MISNDKNIVEFENSENSKTAKEDCVQVCFSSTEAFCSIEAGNSSV